MKKIVCAAVAAAAMLAPAYAQNNQFADSRVITGISADEIAATLQSVGLTTRYLPELQDGTKTIEATSGNESVYIGMRACQGAGGAALCELVQPFGFFSAQGVTLAQINNFNINVSGIATAALLNDGRGIMATKIYLSGGVTSTNVTTELGIFFIDIGRLLQSVTPGAAAQISWRPEDGRPPGAGLDLPAFPGGETARVNQTGVNRGAALTTVAKALTGGDKIGN